ncbi:MAG: DUF2214 family protein [Bradyrhizobium sp.]|nr:DUF2214 family protein [Bradyrhizobium sp.]
MPAYYFHSYAFLTKFSLFIVAALLSTIPTMDFLSWRCAEEIRPAGRHHAANERSR